MSDAKSNIKRALAATLAPVTREDLDWLAAAEVPTPEARALLDAVATSGDSLMDAVKAYRDSLAPKPLEFPGWERNYDEYTNGGAKVWPREDGKGYYASCFAFVGTWSALLPTLPEAIAAAEKMLALLTPKPEPEWGAWTEWTAGVRPVWLTEGESVQIRERGGDICEVTGNSSDIFWVNGGDSSKDPSAFRRHAHLPAYIAWGGGKRPVDDVARVEVVFRDGDTDQSCANSYFWDHRNKTNDIIAYRVVTP